MKKKKCIGGRMNLPRFNGHFKMYTKEYTMIDEGVSNEKEKGI
jgi:hypothetical protein